MTVIVSRSRRQHIGVVGTVVNLLIIAVLNGVIGVVAIYADYGPVVVTGVLTVDVDCVTNVVGAVVLSVE